jgi:hypothetical protein
LLIAGECHRFDEPENQPGIFNGEHMDIISLYNVIAAWVGWPLAFAVFILVASWGYWILKYRINLLQDNKKFLEDKLNDAKNYAPDIVASRLIERHKQLSEVVELLNADVEKNKTEVKLKQEELEQTRREMEFLAEQLNTAYTLLYGELPRNPIISHTVLRHFLLDVQLFSSIYVPLEQRGDLLGKDLDAANKQGPFRLEAEASMHHCHLYIFTASGAEIGAVSNPFRGPEFDQIDSNDYIVTLEILLSKMKADSSLGLPEYKLPVSTKIISVSEINPKAENSISWFLEIPLTTDDVRSNEQVRNELAEHLWENLP